MHNVCMCTGKLGQIIIIFFIYLIPTIIDAFLWIYFSFYSLSGILCHELTVNNWKSLMTNNLQSEMHKRVPLEQIFTSKLHVQGRR